MNDFFASKRVMCSLNKVIVYMTHSPHAEAGSRPNSSSSFSLSAAQLSFSASSVSTIAAASDSPTVLSGMACCWLGSRAALSSRPARLLRSSAISTDTRSSATSRCTQAAAGSEQAGSDPCSVSACLSDGFRVSAEEQYAEGQLAVACSGFSWGGAMCAVAAVVSERKVAAVPCCGSVSPECMVSNRTAVVQPHERQKFISPVRR